MSKLVRRSVIESKGNLDEEIVFDKLIGFSKFFNLLMDKKLPLVGHNLLLDLMMMYQQFIGPLPGKAVE